MRAMITIPAPVALGALLVASLPSAAQQAGTVLRDCPACPELVVVPAGTFTMGRLFPARAAWRLME